MQPNFFSANSPYLAHPMLTAERTAQEVDFVLAKFGLPVGANILDVGCGFGRHSIELARRGFAVMGIDPSKTMVEAARAAANAANVAVDFQVADAVEFRPKTSYDAAICLFTTLGQINEGTQDNRNLLSIIFSALKPHGSLMIEVPDRDKFVAALKPHDRFGSVTAYSDIVREFDSAESIVTERFKIVNAEETRQFLLRYRLFSSTDLTSLLSSAGFGISGAWSDYRGSSVQDAAPMQVVQAFKLHNPNL